MCREAAPRLLMRTRSAVHPLYWITAIGVSAIMMAIAGFAAEIPSSTSFAYQGQLSSNGAFPTSADVRFALFDLQTGGTQIGQTNERTFSALQGGSFATTL